MPMTSGELRDGQILCAGRLRVRFELRRDRFAHVVEMTVNDEWRACFQSMEAAADQSPSVSPVFQEGRYEVLGPSVQEVQLMGRSGGSIFTAAVRADAEAGTIDFDVCARHLRPDVAECASTYEVSPGSGEVSRPEVADTGRIAWTTGRGAWLSIIASNQAECLSEVQSITGDAGQVVVICPRTFPAASSRSGAVRVRWRYRFGPEKVSGTW